MSRRASQVVSQHSGGSAWLPPVAIIALTFAAYLPAMKAGFIWDDDAYVTNNPVLRQPGGLWRIWFEPTATIQYYPLVFTTFWMEHKLWGFNPVGYHVVNIALHAACAVLLWRVLRLLEVPGALLAACLFAVHPVHVESVAWVTERKNVLSLAFYLAAATAYLRFAGLEKPTAITRSAREQLGVAPPYSRWHKKAYVAAMLLFIFALLSKSATMGLPIALALVIWWKRPQQLRSHIVPLLAFIPFIILSAVMTTYVEKHHVGAAEMDWTLTWSQRLLLAARSIWFYLWKLVWPKDLAFIYHREEVRVGDPALYLCLGALVIGLAALWFARNRIGRGPLVAMLFFVITLAPALGFVPFFFMSYSFVADHFQYIASIGPIALFAVILSRISLNQTTPGSSQTVVRAIRTLMVVIVLGLAVLTWRRCGVFLNQETLWYNVLAKSPSAARQAHDNLAVYYAGLGRFAEASEHYQESLRQKPDQPEVLSNLAIALNELSQRDEAIARLREAIRLNPAHAEAQCNLGVFLAAKGETMAAIEHYRMAIAARRDFAIAHFNLARLLAGVGRTQEAAAEYGEVLRIEPEDSDARREVEALMQAQSGKTP